MIGNKMFTASLVFIMQFSGLTVIIMCHYCKMRFLNLNEVVNFDKM